MEYGPDAEGWLWVREFWIFIIHNCLLFLNLMLRNGVGLICLALGLWGSGVTMNAPMSDYPTPFICIDSVRAVSPLGQH